MPVGVHVFTAGELAALAAADRPLAINGAVARARVLDETVLGYPLVEFTIGDPPRATLRLPANAKIASRVIT